MPGGIARASEIVREISKGVSRRGFQESRWGKFNRFFSRIHGGFFFLIIIFLNRMRDVWRKYF